MAGGASEAVARRARTPPDSLGGHVDPWGPYAPRGGNAATKCGNSAFSPSSMQWRGSTRNCTESRAAPFALLAPSPLRRLAEVATTKTTVNGEPSGSKQPVRVAARIIAASCPPRARGAGWTVPPAGYCRLNEFGITLPLLRERSVASRLERGECSLFSDVASRP